MSTYIIAEIGVNHDGAMNKAKELIDMAKRAGADAVKFQTFITENEISMFAEKAEYQKKSTNSCESQLDMVKRYELSFLDFRILKKYCEEINIDFLSTPFDIESAKFLIEDLNMKTIKIPSGEITNAPFLLDISRYGVHIILSTGMATLGEIEDALSVIAFGFTNKNSPLPTKDDFLKAYSSHEGQKLLKEKVSLLHCTTEYPTPMTDVNLKAIQKLSNIFDLPVGYSDHTTGITIASAAVVLGAEIIEKHITYDKHALGPDHQSSIEEEELYTMVKNIRDIEIALGSGVKRPMKTEVKNKEVARKVIVANKNIKKGETFTETNITCKRAGVGISPYAYWSILGLKASKDYTRDERIEERF